MDKELLQAAEALAAGPGSPEQRLERICRLLREKVAHYDWVGVYFADSSREELVLGPYAGEDTEHTRIAYGQGICGQAARRRAAFVVQDVSAESNYLSCSPAVKSEIVMPVFRGDDLLGELDIDSHARAPFTADDEACLEAICRVISVLFP